MSRYLLTLRAYDPINRHARCLVGQEQDGGSIHTSLYITDSRFDSKSSGEMIHSTLPPSYGDLPLRRRRSETCAPSYDTLFPDAY